MLWTTVAIVLLVAVTAVAGLFYPATYAKDTPYSRAGAIGSDLVDLFVVVPVLLVSGIKGYRGSVPAHLVWLGAQGYLLYNFVLYAFGAHFKALVFVYWATLGLCFYATVFSLPVLSLAQIAQAYAPRAPRKSTAILFLLFALPSAALDLREDIAALLAGQVPPSAVAMNQPVIFFHVLDLAFFLPALCIAAILLLRRKAVAYALAPALLASLAIMNIELAAIVAVMTRAGLGMSYAMLVPFAVFAAGSTILLGFYFSSAKKGAWAALPSAA